MLLVIIVVSSILTIIFFGLICWNIIRKSENLKSRRKKIKKSLYCVLIFLCVDLISLIGLRFVSSQTYQEREVETYKLVKFNQKYYVREDQEQATYQIALNENGNFLKKTFDISEVKAYELEEGKDAILMKTILYTKNKLGAELSFLLTFQISKDCKIDFTIYYPKGTKE